MTIVILAVLIWVCPPIVLLAGWGLLDFHVRNRRQLIKGTEADFWLAAEERERFKKAAKQYQAADDNITKANLEGYKAGITRNLDGQWSRKSNIGKEIRETIEFNQGRLNENKAIMDSLKNLPIMRWNAFKEDVVFKYVFMTGCILFVVYFSCFYWKVYPDFWLGLENFTFLSFRYLLKPETLEPVASGEVCFHGIFAVIMICLLCMRNIFKSRAIAITPCPPEVTSKNVDQFSEVELRERAVQRNGR